MNVYYDKDADLSVLQGKKIAVIGYGSQGHAHANNLKDSGCSVVVGVRAGSSTWNKVEAAGLQPADPLEACRDADIVMLLTPDETHPAIYNDLLDKAMKEGAALAFAHGFNIHFSQIEPRADLDVIMIAPKGPGHLVRATYTRGAGVPGLIAIARDATGHAQEIALSYACAIGAGRAGIIETTFREETETDLFGEQAVLCGGVTALIQAGFETLVDAGYAPEMAYFECLHEVKLIVDLIYEGGIANMRYSISNTAEYGDFTRGPRIINDDVRAEMRKILGEIQKGEFAREFILENQAGKPTLKAQRRIAQSHQIEQVGEKLRAMMLSSSGDKLVDRSRN